MSGDAKAWEGHTPGPWARNIPPVRKYPTIYAGRNKHVAQVYVTAVSDEEAEANAALIAAAPELAAEVAWLRAALEDAVSGLRYIEQQHGRLSGVGWDRVYDAARAALAPTLEQPA